MKTSEFVTLGHPDKIADYISEYILDRYMERDKHVRYALEVQIKDNFVSLGGEITSSASFTDEEMRKFVADAVRKIGYTHAYAEKWGFDCVDCDSLEVTQHISK